MSFESVVSLPPSLDRRPRLLSAAMAWGAEIAQYFIDEASSLIKGVNMKSMFAAYVEDQVEGALCLGALSVCRSDDHRCAVSLLLPLLSEILHCKVSLFPKTKFIRQSICTAVIMRGASTNADKSISLEENMYIKLKRGRLAA